MLVDILVYRVQLIFTRSAQITCRGNYLKKVARFKICIHVHYIENSFIISASCGYKHVEW